MGLAPGSRPVALGVTATEPKEQSELELAEGGDLVPASQTVSSPSSDGLNGSSGERLLGSPVRE